LRHRGGEGEWIATNDKTTGRDEAKRKAGEGLADSDPSSRIPDSGCFFIIAIDWNISPVRTCRAALRQRREIVIRQSVSAAAYEPRIISELSFANS